MAAILTQPQFVNFPNYFQHLNVHHQGIRGETSLPSCIKVHPYLQSCPAKETGACGPYNVHLKNGPIIAN